jgi:hypothetical protein
MVKVASANRALPNQFFLREVTFEDLQSPWRSGGYADIFEGIFKGTKIVGKRLRVFGVDKTDFHTASSFLK